MSDFSLSAIIQIAILYAVFLAILKAAKGSRFGQVLLGVGLLAGTLVAFAYVFEFDVLSAIIRSLLVYLAISTVVIFQPEIRRMLSQLGAFGFFERPKTDANGVASPDFIVTIIQSLADHKIGALLAFERGISLRSYESTGVIVNADFSQELVTCIFTPPLPLHDGGMTVRNGRISAAHCVFPVSNNPSLSVSGMRHRAAVGLSEETDALVVVVSEESGAVSIARNGRLVRYHGAEIEPALRRWIPKVLPSAPRTSQFIARLQDKAARLFTQKEGEPK